MDMSTPYEATGRTAQKQRTRTALIEAACALISQGLTPTVEEAATAASISRTTAYRYFPTQRDLLIAAYPHTDRDSLLGDQPPEDLAERLDLVVCEYLRITVDNEIPLRAALQVSLTFNEGQQQDPYLRRGRVIRWLSDALTPLAGQVSEQAMIRLIYAIRASAGLESLIWLCDVAGLSREEAIEVMRWSAQSLLRATLAEASANQTATSLEQGGA